MEPVLFPLIYSRSAQMLPKQTSATTYVSFSEERSNGHLAASEKAKRVSIPVSNLKLAHNRLDSGAANEALAEAVLAAACKPPPSLPSLTEDEAEEVIMASANGTGVRLGLFITETLATRYKGRAGAGPLSVGIPNMESAVLQYTASTSPVLKNKVHSGRESNLQLNFNKPDRAEKVESSQKVECSQYGARMEFSSPGNKNILLDSMSPEERMQKRRDQLRRSTNATAAAAHASAGGMGEHDGSGGKVGAEGVVTPRLAPPPPVKQANLAQNIVHSDEIWFIERIMRALTLILVLFTLPLSLIFCLKVRIKT
ncbi:unnamed protein product [Protopolystoma xenopodis]|uniref:Uncharacterized protein n=1 Tax=Protopolystoma xenopodis TaxID=117903 RepID=A0A3S5ABW3_9PLAT|nr:unnamed protein product [Protopolystoma xenopodis]